MQADQDHSRGPARADHTLIQYGDYECPYCHRDQPALARLLDKHGERVRFVFRHYPLAAEHPNAQRAARAAEGAARQGRFWEMHDALMRKSPPLDDEALAACAESAGADPRRILAEIDDPALGERVRRDVDLAEEDGIRGTPWYLLDGAAAGPLRALADRLRSDSATGADR